MTATPRRFLERRECEGYHALPVMGLAVVPTRGQTLFLFYIIAINIILSSVRSAVTSGPSPVRHGGTGKARK